MNDLQDQTKCKLMNSCILGCIDSHFVQLEIIIVRISFHKENFERNARDHIRCTSLNYIRAEYYFQQMFSLNPNQLASVLFIHISSESHQHRIEIHKQ